MCNDNAELSLFATKSSTGLYTERNGERKTSIELAGVKSGHSGEALVIWKGTINHKVNLEILRTTKQTRKK